jgi:hypothetical protein
LSDPPVTCQRSKPRSRLSIPISDRATGAEQNGTYRSRQVFVQ